MTSPSSILLQKTSHLASHKTPFFVEAKILVPCWQYWPLTPVLNHISPAHISQPISLGFLLELDSFVLPRNLFPSGTPSEVLYVIIISNAFNMPNPCHPSLFYDLKVHCKVQTTIYIYTHTHTHTHTRTHARARARACQSILKLKNKI